MKKQHIGAFIGLLSLSSGSAAIVAGDPNEGGIGYQWSVTLDGNGSVTTPHQDSHVGAWSWEDESLFGEREPTVGWTHASHWVALELTSDALFTLEITRNSEVPDLIEGGFYPTDQLFPSLTIWAGWDNETEVLHSYNNRGDLSWTDALTFVGLVDNSEGPIAEGTWALEAGQYTIVIGSNAASDSNPPRQAYQAIFTTNPIPEPSSALLMGIGLFLTFLRRRR